MKLGFQAPKKSRHRHFSNIEINGDFAFCKSGNFVYNPEAEEEKLYNAQPCHYTDNRYYDGYGNFYHRAYIVQVPRGHQGKSFKTCKRIVKHIFNIPVGTIVDFTQDWYIPGKRINFGFKYKVKKENNFDPNYEINKTSFTENFTNDTRSAQLVDLLRENGFIVSVAKNTSFLLGMIDQASKLTGKERVDTLIDGEIATAWGYGKKIGFSSFDNDYMGYSNGCESILWDKFGEFDKWSRCYEIDKKASFKEIVKILKTKNDKR